MDASLSGPAMKTQVGFELFLRLRDYLLESFRPADSDENDFLLLWLHHWLVSAYTMSPTKRLNDSFSTNCL